MASHHRGFISFFPIYECITFVQSEYIIKIKNTYICKNTWDLKRMCKNSDAAIWTTFIVYKM